VQSATPESSGISAWHASPAMKDSCPTPGMCMESMPRKPTVVGKQETSLRVPGKVKTDETGQSPPISAACQSAWRIAGLAAPPSIATAKSSLKLVCHAFWLLWYPI
jgi:hypothetical protein